jgi:hypothetical protein
MRMKWSEPIGRQRGALGQGKVWTPPPDSLSPCTVTQGKGLKD